METKVEPYYQNEAKQITDTLFETRLFAETTTRDQIQAVEDYIAFYLQSNADSARRSLRFAAEYKKVAPNK